MFMKHTQELKKRKKSAICLAYVLFLSQSHAMQEIKEEKTTPVKLIKCLNKKEYKRWEELDFKENTFNINAIKMEINNLEASIFKREKCRKNLEDTSINKTKIFLDKEKYNLIGVALFSGADLVSNLVKYSTNSTISHVGIILSDQNDENKWYCFESTGSEKEVKKGIYPHVRLTSWNKVVEKYDGDVSYRLFIFTDRERIDSKQVTNFVEKYNGKSYTKNPLTLLGALSNINNSSNLEILKTVFCSELAAKMLMEFKILEECIESNCLPKDFTSKEMDFIRKSRISLKPSVELTLEFKAKSNGLLNYHN